MMTGSPSKILVTGGAGYVGSHTAALLLEQGYAVDVFDNLSTGHAAAVPTGAKLIEGDLSDARAVRLAISEGSYDAVMHFAALSLVGESMREPYRYLLANLTGALNLLDAMAKAGIQRFILSSTANLFSETKKAIDENAPIAPGSPYGESKYAVERALIWAERIHGIRHAALRYFNAAGADPEGARGEDHNPETHLIPLVLQAALGQRQRIDIFGNDYPTPDGTCIRDYVHVRDLAEAHALALKALDNRSFRYNLGTGRGHSVREVIDTACTVTGREIPFQIAERRAGDPPKLVADATRIKHDLGWTPRLDFRETIATAWEWHHRHPSGFSGMPERISVDRG